MKAAILIAALLSATTAHADEWTGRDKTLHLAGGFVIGATVATFTNQRTGFIAGAAVGLAKEVYDYRSRSRGGAHDPSAKDFAVTALGALAGSYVPGLVIGLRSISYTRSF